MSGTSAQGRLRVAPDVAELPDPRSSIVAALLDRWLPIMPSVDGKVLSVLFPDDRPGSAAELDHDPRYLIGRLSQALTMLLERAMPPMDATAQLLCEAIGDAIDYRRACCPRCPADGICERCLPGWRKASAYEWLMNELGIIDDGHDWAPRAVLRAADHPGGQR